MQVTRMRRCINTVTINYMVPNRERSADAFYGTKLLNGVFFRQFPFYRQSNLKSCIYKSEALLYHKIEIRTRL